MKKKKPTKRKTSRKSKTKQRVRYNFSLKPGSKKLFASLGLILITLLSAVSLFNQDGVILQGIFNSISKLFGFGVYLTPFVLAWATFKVMSGFYFKKDIPDEEERVVPVMLWIFAILGGLSCLGLLEHLTSSLGGGFLGQSILSITTKLAGANGSVVVLSVILLGSLYIVFHDVFLSIKDIIVSLRDFVSPRRNTSSDSDFYNDEEDTNESYQDEPEEEPEQIIEEENYEENIERKLTPTNFKDSDSLSQKEYSSSIKARFSEYTPPPINLLDNHDKSGGTTDVKEAGNLIVSTLRNFNINVSLEEVDQGPSVTRFALRPEVGIKLSRITGLQNELALALAAHPIRIEAPIPGKSLVGIEIPNKKRATVGLRSILANRQFLNSKKRLLVSLGRGVSGQPFYGSVAKMPHILIAGATGSGKSGTAHSFIVSLLYQNGPEQVRLIMVDPKRVELTLYDGIPHLLTPVIKQAKKAILALSWAVKEMERRYDVLEKYKVRDIGTYHEQVMNPAYSQDIEKLSDEEFASLPEKMPYIVIMIDELADLMQLYPRELEASIVRLAQMSRAVGIHLVISTQRPSVNVITGLIKANIPARIALRVSSQIDSRTILDGSGAETLLGAGDMLYKGNDATKPSRIQCAWVSGDEVKKVVKFIIKNNKNMSLSHDDIDFSDESSLQSASGISMGSSSNDDSVDDPLFQEAKAAVLEAGKASTSYLQRKLRVGYSRAARLIDTLEEAGIIGPARGSKPREILIANKDPEIEQESENSEYLQEELL